ELSDQTNSRGGGPGRPFSCVEANSAFSVAERGGRLRKAPGYPGLLGGAVMAGPQEVTLRGRRPPSHADREQAIGTLKAGFVHGRLTKDEFDARIAQALGCVTYAELAALTADLPVRSPPPPPRPVSNALRWAASGLMTPAALAAAFLLASVRGAGAAGAVVL